MDAMHRLRRRCVNELAELRMSFKREVHIFLSV